MPLSTYSAPTGDAIDQHGELVGHGRNRFRRAEFAPEATILGAETTLAPKERGDSDPQGGGGSIVHVARAATPLMRWSS